MFSGRFPLPARVILGSHDSRSHEPQSNTSRLVASVVPVQTVEYVNNVSFSREEVNAAFARARAQGTIVDAE